MGGVLETWPVRLPLKLDASSIGDGETEPSISKAGSVPGSSGRWGTAVDRTSPCRSQLGTRPRADRAVDIVEAVERHGAPPESATAESAALIAATLGGGRRRVARGQTLPTTAATPRSPLENDFSAEKPSKICCGRVGLPLEDQPATGPFDELAAGCHFDTRSIGRTSRCR